jgi:ketosteroid isomerase-like protein
MALSLCATCSSPREAPDKSQSLPDRAEKRILRAVSQENVEIVRAGFEAWNAGDVDALREVFDPDVIVRLPEGWPEPGPFVGREEVMRQWERNREVWDTDTLEPVNFIDAGDRVVVRFIWRGGWPWP